MADGIKEIRQRLDMLEAQHAITFGFTRFLIHALLSEQPEPERSALQATLEKMFEHTIAGLLASEYAFPDISIRAVEIMREKCLTTLLHDQRNRLHKLLHKMIKRNTINQWKQRN